jgi:hypothetical protein
MPAADADGSGEKSYVQTIKDLSHLDTKIFYVTQF